MSFVKVSELARDWLPKGSAQFFRNNYPLAQLSVMENTIMVTVENYIKGNWNRQVNAARIAWNRLTEDELLASDGEHEKLVALVQERYGICRDEAFRRVRNFMEARQ